MQRWREKLTYANVAATVALVIAVAGGTTAIAGVAKAPKNSVVAKSIKNGNVTATELAGLTPVTSTAPIADASQNDGNAGFGTTVARCPKGARAITGGGAIGGNHTAIQGSTPSGNDAWIVVASNDSGNTTQVVASVLCLPASPAKPYKVP